MRGTLTNIHTSQSDFLKQLYLDVKPWFLVYAKNKSLDEASGLDVYQDAFLAFYARYQSGKLASYTGSLEAYLKGICKNKLVDHFNRQSKYQEVSDHHLSDLEEAPQDAPLGSEMFNRLRISLKQLGKSCKEVLTLFYLRGYTIRDITEHLDYANENTVKAQKSRCLKTLREHYFGKPHGKI